MDGFREAVREFFEKEKSGHGFDHALRTEKLARKFAEELGADEEIVAMAALLHDVDDYKLVGEVAAKRQENARWIMEQFEVATEKQGVVLEIIRTMGYSNYLAGVRPRSLEGMCVSDADMCDACGAEGVARALQYSASLPNGKLFDRDELPNVGQNAASYRDKATRKNNCAVNHFFEKLLILPGIMMTEAGKREAAPRKQIMVDFLRELFREEDALEWNKYLDQYLVGL